MIINAATVLRRTPKWMRLLLVIPVLMLSGSLQAAEDTQPRLLLLGDSISAAYGMSLREGWVAMLQERMNEESLDWHVVNASISGETSAGGSARLPALLEEHQPEIVVIELGGNDGLRGYPIKRMRENIAGMIAQSQSIGADVMLLGMEIPPNYGSRYSQMFRDSYSQLADKYETELVPFFMENVATNPKLMQSDGIHPTVEAQIMLLDNVWPALRAMLGASIEP